MLNCAIATCQQCSQELDLALDNLNSKTLGEEEEPKAGRARMASSRLLVTQESHKPSLVAKLGSRRSKDSIERFRTHLSRDSWC